MVSTKLKRAKKRANTAFSRFIRTKYADKNGMVQCYTCTTIKPIKQMQAGHGIPSRTNAVLYMEEVVRSQCYACNILANGRYKTFTPKLIAELGEKRYNELVIRSNQTIKFSAEDYLDIEKRYQDKLKQLK